MSDFAGMEDLLQDFLTEASDLLLDVDAKLVELEKTPDDGELLNSVFRDFHTIKGGAGFLQATALVELCHKTENLFDGLRHGKITLSPELMDAIMAGTAEVHRMFSELRAGHTPHPAHEDTMAALRAGAEGAPVLAAAPPTRVAASAPAATEARADSEPDWEALYRLLVGAPEAVERTAPAAPPRAAPPAKKPAGESGKEAASATIRVDTARLDMVLNLSGELGLTKNRLTCLRSSILQGKTDAGTLKALDEAVSQLDLLVGDLQNSVMKTRMQPIGRLFQKYPRLARDLARQLGKDVELVLSGEETEIDKTMIEDLGDPLVHLVRNAVDHGVESAEDRQVAGKPAKSVVRLSARQMGDQILIEIADDGKGMSAEMIRKKAVEKGLLSVEEANALDDRQALNLIFLPGFSTKDQVSDVSGRGVGMDVVKTHIQKLNGRIDVVSSPGKGSVFTIVLPLTLAILTVLIVRQGGQAFAMPLAMVKEIVPIDPAELQHVSGRESLIVRGEVLPVRHLSHLLGQPGEVSRFGALMQAADYAFVMGFDDFIGRDDVVIKPLTDIAPKGVAGATLSGDGNVVLVLNIEELLSA